MSRSESGPRDATLVLRARDGDAGAFEQLVRRHYRAAFAVARGRVQNAMDAEDTVQDAFVRALERLDDCDPERFAGWLLTVVRNRAHNVRVYEDRRGGMDPEDAGLAARERDEPTRRLAGSELREALEDAIDELSPVRREVLLLHDLQGLAHAEIAGSLDISVGMSRYHLMHARREMRERLDRDLLELEDHGG